MGTIHKLRDNFLATIASLVIRNWEFKKVFHFEMHCSKSSSSSGVVQVLSALGRGVRWGGSGRKKGERRGVEEGSGMGMALRGVGEGRGSRQSLRWILGGRGQKWFFYDFVIYERALRTNTGFIIKCIVNRYLSVAKTFEASESENKLTREYNDVIKCFQEIAKSFPTDFQCNHMSSCTFIQFAEIFVFLF